MRLFAGLAAIIFVCWGALHIFYGVTGLTELANADKLTTEGGWLAQTHFTLVWEGAIALISGLFFTWRNSVVAYWLLAIIVSANEIGNYLFRILPELIDPPFSMISPVLGVSGLVFATIAILTRPSPNGDSQS